MKKNESIEIDVKRILNNIVKLRNSKDYSNIDFYQRKLALNSKEYVEFENAVKLHLKSKRHVPSKNIKDLRILLEAGNFFHHMIYWVGNNLLSIEIDKKNSSKTTNIPE